MKVAFNDLAHRSPDVTSGRGLMEIDHPLRAATAKLHASVASQATPARLFQTIRCLLLLDAASSDLNVLTIAGSYSAVNLS